MKGATAIARREWLSYFFTPLGYVILAAFWFLNGLIFDIVIYYFNQGNNPIEQPLSVVFTNFYIWIFMLFFAPAITMRLLSEERRSGSLELLLTAPVNESGVVLGKYLAALGFYAILWAPMAIYALVLSQYLTIDWGVVLSGLLSVALLGCLFLAIGTFASSLAKNQIISAVIAFVVMVPVFSVGLVASLANDPKWKDALSYFNMWDHMDEFARGVVDTRRLVYYVSVTAFFLYLAIVALKAKKGE
jgi:gliding motility-associated transport system permease protein